MDTHSQTPTEQDRVSDLASGAMVRRLWATSVIMQTRIPGRLDNVVGYREAVSEAEAKGLAIEAAEKLNPTSQLSGVAVCEIEQRHIDRMATPNTSGETRRQ